MMHRDRPVWLITGCSTGFGRELARLVIARGWRAVVTARDVAKVADLVAGHDEQAIAVTLDVTDRAQIDGAVAAAIARFGRVDVLVNNAGFGYLGAVEEGEDAAVRALFDTNVFGLIDMTKAVLPAMRAQASGLIVTVSSIGGLVSSAGTGYYHASKYAVEGLSESLAVEVKPLGIDVLIVEPGPFRTLWAGASMTCVRNGGSSRFTPTLIVRPASSCGKKRSGSGPANRTPKAPIGLSPAPTRATSFVKLGTESVFRIASICLKRL